MLLALSNGEAGESSSGLPSSVSKSSLTLAAKNVAGQTAEVCRMERNVAKSMSMDTNERQRRYVESQKARGTSVGIVFADAFLRGIRDLGYKNPAWALAEMIDNAIQAAATQVAVLFGFKPENNSQA